MRTAIPLLFLFFFFSARERLSAQNLIPDPGVEMMTACPDNIAFLDDFLEHWFTVRQLTAYLHSCQDTLQLNGGWNSMFGYQEPLVGDSYIGGATFHYLNLTNRRGYFATLLTEPLEVGEDYYLSFHVSMAYNSPGPMWATNNIGALLMTENYLAPDPLDPIPNFSHFAVDSIITDTTNWVRLHGVITADSAYTMIAFGNFYESDLTSFEAPYNENPTANPAYYFYDDFCLSKNFEDCGLLLNADQSFRHNEVEVFPVPAGEFVNVRSSDRLIRSVQLADIQGRIILRENGLSTHRKRISLSAVRPGVYVMWIQTEAGAVSRKIVVQHP